MKNHVFQKKIKMESEMKGIHVQFFNNYKLDSDLFEDMVNWFNKKDVSFDGWQIRLSKKYFNAFVTDDTTDSDIDSLIEIAPDFFGERTKASRFLPKPKENYEEERPRERRNNNSDGRSYRGSYRNNNNQRYENDGSRRYSENRSDYRNNNRYSDNRNSYDNGRRPYRNSNRNSYDDE